MSESLTKYESHGRFIEIDGKPEQLSIYKVTDQEDHVSVITGPGCSKPALKQTMQKIANDVNKVVEGLWNDEPISVEPEQSVE